MAKEASLDDCLNLLKGDSDEQRLVGLLLATKFVKGDDMDAVRKLFDAVGFHFINRLIRTGTAPVGKGRDQRQSYLHLALSVLAAFCRIPELAAAEETVAKVPVLLATLMSRQDEGAAGDCFECLLSIAISSEMGLLSLLESRILPVIAHKLHDSSPDALWIPVALKLLHSLLLKVASDSMVAEYAQDLAYVVPSLAKQLAFQQDAIKFEALSILYSLLVSDISLPIRAALGDSARQSQWPAHARTGLGQILHSRVAVEQKYLVLELSESIIKVVGETWLVGFMDFPGRQGPAPPYRFFLLMVETLRVETAVLLNEVARVAFDPGEGLGAQPSKAAEAPVSKRRRLLKCFALLEHLISVMAIQEECAKDMDEMTLQNIIVALDEVVGVVIELLEDAQKVQRNRGHILLASVRIVSRYLAESPTAHRKRCLNILHFVLSVSTDSDSRPFLAVQFMLPFLTQLTLELDGCQALLAGGSHVQIITFLSWAVHRTNETKASLVDTCDILLNLLTKKDQLTDEVDFQDFIPVLPALATWVGQGISDMESAMAASVCTSVLTLTSESVLRNSSELGSGQLENVYEVIILNVEQCLKGKRADDLVDEEDLLEIVLQGSLDCLNRYPSFKQSLRAWVQHLTGNRHLSSIQGVASNSSLQQLLAMVLMD